MGMVVRSNIMAMNANRQLGVNNSAVAKSLEKLSSGFKINRAADDASGLAISEKMKAQIKGLETASANAQDGISLVQTAEGALTEVHDMLNRMVELATKSANGTIQDEVDREAIQSEVNALNEEIDRISKSTNFNGINLLDGSLSKQDLTAVPVTYDTISTAKGVEIGTQNAGGGTKGEFSIDLKTLYGTGDSITFSGTDATGTVIGGDIKLTFDGTKKSATSTTFSGETLEEQAKSIADALKLNSPVAMGFDVSVEGTKVTLTAKDEGTGKASISKIITKDQTVALGAVDTTASKPGTVGATTYDGGFDSAFTSVSAGAGGLNADVDDILEFAFKGANGEDLVAKVTVTADMYSSDIGDFTTNIVNKLMETKFVDQANTAADESRMKVGDLFEFKANTESDGSKATKGAIYVKAKNAGAFSATSITNTGKDGTGTTKVTSTQKTAGTSAGADPKHIYKLKAPAAIGTTDPNFSAGDIFKVTGQLSDGRNFTVNLEAGKDFAIGTHYGTSMDEIIKALKGTTPDGHKVAVEMADGTKIDSDKIFGTAAGTEFDVTTGSSDGVLTITSNKAGVSGAMGIAGKIDSVSVTPKGNADADVELNAAEAQASASSTVTLNKDIQYGAAIKIGDKTFEIVKDARDVSNRNNAAVVINDLESTSITDITSALKDAVTKAYADEKASDGVTAKYTVKAEGDTLTITSNDKGSDIAAIEIATPYGDKVTTASFKFDPSKISEKATFTFNGNQYEFVKKGDEASKGKIAIEMDSFSNKTAADYANAFADVAKNGKVTVAADGTVTLQSLEGEDGTISKPSIGFYQGLTLQIGDTNEDFQKVSLSVEDMSSVGLGVNGLDVGNAEAAGNAMDTIKSAINKVSTNRANMGALQNRLEHTINNLDVAVENMSSANSRIRDTDMAKEMMNYTKMNVLTQAAQAMLAQANQQPQSILQLLQ